MEPVAIVGMSCLFPDAETPDQFWQNLMEGRDSRSTASVNELAVDPRLVFSDEKGRPDKMYSRQGAYVRGFTPDLSGFAVESTALEQLDDLFKWSLYVGREALKDAGCWEANNEQLRRCGLVLGNLSFPTPSSHRFYHQIYKEALDPLLRELLGEDAFELPALADEDGSTTNTRISGFPSILTAQALSLTGPTMSVDAACASSLYALDVACRHLNSNRADMMLAGAVSCADPLFIRLGFSIFQAYPHQADSRPLDEDSRGLIDGQGAGMLVLKRLRDAHRDGDRVHAVIRGIGLSNDGRAGSVLSPCTQGQIRAFERAYDQARIDPGEVDYVECHATGTPAGDPVELESMTAFWRDRPLPRIGSVKSNLGHLLTASGVASLIKVALSLKHDRIPPTINVTNPRTSHDGSLGPDHVVVTTTPWPDRGQRRIAGVNAFGFGGTNAHLVLEADDGEPIEPATRGRQVHGMAVVGAAATFGGCQDLAALAHTAECDASHVGALPADRWAGLETSLPAIRTMGTAPRGAYLDETSIDFLRLRTPPRESDQLIPQQLLMMQVADKAIRDAGLQSGGRVAVLIALEAEPAIHRFLVRIDLSWQLRAAVHTASIPLSDEQIADLEDTVQSAVCDVGSAGQFSSYIGNIVAGRIASLWDFTGPALTISAEELGVARALDTAEMMLADQMVDAVVVGAVDLAGGFESVLAKAMMGVMPESVGEGAGAVVLTRRNTDSSDAQYAYVERIGFDETGQGQSCFTELASAREMSGCGDGQFGRVSRNLGHAGQASGMAALIRVSLGLSQGTWQRANVVMESADGVACVELSSSGRNATRQTPSRGAGDNGSTPLLRSVPIGRTPIREALQVDTDTRYRMSPAQRHGAYLQARTQALRDRLAGLRADLMTSSGAVRPVWDQRDLETFASGRIADVFGPEYAAIDSYSRRVRLPMHPYLLVSRVTHVDGQRGVFKPSSITTEYDIPNDAWYSVDGRPCWAVVVESGQCDLLLISYLGIDLECQGYRVYRLLDCSLTFLDRMPTEGDTLRYEIRINSFSRSGDSLLFFFSYECFVGDRLILRMEDGCAGFFADAELAQGKGVILKDSDRPTAAGGTSFTPLLACDRTRFERHHLQALLLGDLEPCFGPSHRSDGKNTSLRLPPEAMLMIDRVVSVDPTGGSARLGVVVAEKDLAPDHWYFPCHFMDDQVLAGSLMGEACAQILQFYALFVGLQTKTSDACFEPCVGLKQRVKCRGQVIPSDRLLRYRLEVKRLDLDPVPTLVADVEVWLEDKMVVHFQDLGLQLVEKAPVPTRAPVVNRSSFGVDEIRQFATGSMEACFGQAYGPYDTRRCPRTPNGDLMLITRVDVHGHSGGPASALSLYSEYDVPRDPWYYDQCPGRHLPYSILMEIALQPSGFLTAYHGSTLPYPEVDFYYRNLDGQGFLTRDIDVRGKTIGNRMHFLSSTALEGVVIQKYAFELFCEGDAFYRGNAAFGFFSKAALDQQVGLDEGHTVEPWYRTTGEQADAVDLPNLQSDDPSCAGFHVASGQLHFIDAALVVPDGGKYGQGYVFASRLIDPTDWFYACHFHQDPVMPGSLGVEAMLQALQVFALQTGLGSTFDAPRFGLTDDHQTTWKYRGQIMPTQKNFMAIEVHVKGVRRANNRIVVVADASLWNGDLRIYEVLDLSLSILDTSQRGRHVN